MQKNNFSSADPLLTVFFFCFFYSSWFEERRTKEKEIRFLLRGYKSNSRSWRKQKKLRRKKKKERERETDERVRESAENQLPVTRSSRTRSSDGSNF